MRRLWCASVVFFAVCSGSAFARTQDSALLEGLGIDGRWARDCHGPPGAKNPYTVYATPDQGQPTEKVVGEDGSERVAELLDVQWLKTRELVWVIAEGEVMITIVTKLEGNRMRTWSSSATDGPQYVSKGKFGDGKPTPWLNKCETN